MMGDGLLACNIGLPFTLPLLPSVLRWLCDGALLLPPLALALLLGLRHPATLALAGTTVGVARGQRDEHAALAGARAEHVR